MDEKSKLKKKKVDTTGIYMGLNPHIQSHGEAASQILQAYKGARYDSAGNDLNHQGRNLKDISNYKLNDDFREQNIKQQSGFSAELLKEARDNKQAILDGDKTRTRTSDGIGNTNDQKYDHVKLDEHGSMIENSGSQMKFYKDPNKVIKKWLMILSGGKNIVMLLWICHQNK